MLKILKFFYSYVNVSMWEKRDKRKTVNISTYLIFDTKSIFLIQRAYIKQNLPTRGPSM